MESRGLKDIPLPYEADEGYPKHPVMPYNYGPGSGLLPSFLTNLKIDDIILIFLIILLLLEGSECDYLLVGVLVVVFLAGIDGNFLGILG